MDAIVVEALTKAYGDVRAVDGASFRVPRGAVFGFLGPNGSGKTTTLGMLTGLIAPDAGHARIAGAWGALVEEPAFYPYLTGAKNVELVATLMGAPRERVASTLAQVGLAGAADRKYRGYSQGMRRRLGLAAAMVSEPDVLVLDEPTNGLDPAGQREVRDLLREYARAGRTVLLSSHQLHEVQEVCTHAAILRKGRVVAKGRMEELLAPEDRLLVAVDDAERALRALAQLPGVRASRHETAQLLVEAPPGSAALVNRALVEAGVAVSALTPTGGRLEERFFEMTEEPR